MSAAQINIGDRVNALAWPGVNVNGTVIDNSDRVMVTIQLDQPLDGRDVINVVRSLSTVISGYYYLHIGII